MALKITHSVAELSALFPPNTAGRDMISNIPIFSEKATAEQVRKYISKHAKNYESLNYIYAVNRKSELLGVASIKEIMHADAKKTLGKIMIKNVVAVNPMDTEAHVALLALRHNLKMIPIVDHKNRLVGAFSSNLLLDILNKEFSNDLLKLSGVRIPRKHFHFDQSKVVYSRLPWMLVGMIGGLATGLIIGAFKSSIEAIVS